MCTAVSWNSGYHYFGRNLDLDHSYNEAVTVTPRKFPFSFRNSKKMHEHYAIIGMATTVSGYPLYYDATNEYGLSIAGLNFPGNAVFTPPVDNKENIASFELVPWLLCQCQTVTEAISLLSNTHLTNEKYNEDLPVAPLHWMISDKKSSFALENTGTGLQIHDDPVHVLTNNPPFEYHMTNLCNYMQLSPNQPANTLCSADLTPYSLGMGAAGLPGDLSSASRFVRAVFTRNHMKTYDKEEIAIAQFFHLLDIVSQTEGCVKTKNGLEKTIYSSCCNTDKGIYYYTTSANRQITAVMLTRQNMDTSSLSHYPLRYENNILYENKRV